ncbi:MAG: DNA-processing protein DprA [Prevotella sp.]|nr:DNA-processing protein DprA [Prevotella sp.]
MEEQEILNMLTLTKMGHFNLVEMLQLYRAAGSATAIIENRKDIKSLLPDCSQKVFDSLQNIDDVRKLAENELEFSIRNDINILPIGTQYFPHRLEQCEDAPLILFFKGTSDLNRKRIINIVGTRHCTSYGQDVVKHFVEDLRQLSPEVLIVSGLAYGIDICAHRAALENGFDTVAVLAHGLDYLYPTLHKSTADRMFTQGGLLTEFFTNTNADKLNFLRRNRIVAGISDATILVESAAHGGGLVTARISESYNRDVYAFPGNVNARYSEGCNNLIRDNRAGLISNADDFVNAMGWQDDAKISKARKKGIERMLFPELTDDEKTIVDALLKVDNQQVNNLSSQLGMPMNRLAASLFSLEMKGVVRVLAGGVYHLIIQQDNGK